MQKNTIVIATGYQALFAYLLIPKGDPQLVKRIEFACDGQTDCPLVRWDDKRLCYIELAEIIDRILNRYACEAWGLACRSEQIAPLRAELPEAHISTLAAVMETDGDPIDLTNVTARFMAATEVSKLAAVSQCRPLP